MTIETAEFSGASVIRPGDTLDLLGYQALTETIDKLLKEGKRKVIVDLEATTYINSTAALCLLSAAAKAAKAGGGLALARPEASIAPTLEAFGLKGQVGVFATLEEAVSNLG